MVAVGVGISLVSGDSGTLLGASLDSGDGDGAELSLLGASLLGASLLGASLLGASLLGASLLGASLAVGRTCRSGG